MKKDVNTQHKHLRKRSEWFNNPWWMPKNSLNAEKRLDEFLTKIGLRAILFCVGIPSLALMVFFFVFKFPFEPLKHENPSVYETVEFFIFNTLGVIGLSVLIAGLAMLNPLLIAAHIWENRLTKKFFNELKQTHWETPTQLWEVINLEQSKKHLPNALIDRAREKLPATIAAAEILDWANTYPDRKNDPQVVEAKRILTEAENFINTTLKEAYTASIKEVKYFESEKARPQHIVEVFEPINESPFADEALMYEWKKKLQP